MTSQRSISTVRRGFTILELIMVVVMMAVIATISLGRTGSLLTSWRVNRAAQAMTEELQQAYAIVGRNRRPVIINVDTVGMALYIRDRADTTIIFRRRDVGLNSEFKLSAGDMKASTGRLEVYPPGLAADSLWILVSKNGTGRRVRMLRGGLALTCTSTVRSHC